MSRKNNTIVAIVAHPKMHEGDQLFIADGSIERIVLLGRPYWKPYIALEGGSWWYKFRWFGTEVAYIRSCEDDGIPGFAYDCRPCRLVKTYKEAEASLAATEKWWDENPNDHMDIGYHDFD